MLIRKRYYFWLFKAYLKRWKKTVIASIVIGVSAFFGLVLLLNYYVFPIFSNKHEKIGYSGSYTLSSLPDEILKNISYGLTVIDSKGQIKNGIAKSWEISQDGKVYTFHLRENLLLSDGKKFDVRGISYTFKDVTKKFIDKDTVEFTLKDPYSPFLSVVEKPIVSKNVGFNEYKIGETEENSGFIKSLTLINNKDNRRKVIYFYPTELALKTAFQLGEIEKANNLSYSASLEKDFDAWEGVKVNKKTDYSNLVTVFFNVNDKILSNKKVRQALVYAMPANFDEGEKTFSFIPAASIYYTKSPNEGLIDVELSKSLLESADTKNPEITIQTSEKYHEIAKKVAKSWKKLGVNTEVKTTAGVPVSFQAFLSSVKISKDPDMYALWHSSQPSNISHYKNVRIDKLLEDGRQEASLEERIRIYADVQKYLLDDAPAGFLYFPYTYTISRK